MENQNNNQFNKMFFKKDGSPQYAKATVVAVNTEKHIFDAISEDGLRFFQKCQYLEITPDLSGKINPPSSGDTCIVKLNTDGTYELEKLYTAPQVDSTGSPSRDLGPYNKILPGDRIDLAKGGAFLSLLRGGIAKIGSSPICQLIFMKLENYARLISRNIEIISSGFIFYSVNDSESTITRLSIFLKDSMSKEMRSKSSEFSDFEVAVKDSTISIITGPKDPASNMRIDTCVVNIANDGSMSIYQSDKTTKRITQRIAYTPNGCSDHTIYGAKNKVIYQRKVIRNPSDSSPHVMVKEKVNGQYDLIVEGGITITASKDLAINGKNISSNAEVINSIKANAHLVDAKVKS